MKPVEVRSQLVEALQIDLVGPLPVPEHARYASEVLNQRPSNWYLTGFLAPSGARPPAQAAQAGVFSEKPPEGGFERAVCRPSAVGCYVHRQERRRSLRTFDPCHEFRRGDPPRRRLTRRRPGSPDALGIAPATCPKPPSGGFPLETPA